MSFAGSATAASAALLTIAGLEKKRPATVPYCLSIGSLTLQRGYRYSLLGESGSGKSTAMDLFSMILRPDTADVFTFHTDTASIDVAQAWKTGTLDALAAYRGQFLGYVLQTGGLMPFLSVYENIMLSRQVKGLPGEGSLPVLVKKLGIAHLLDKKAGAISVGERQRVSIARALAHDPLLVLADEPTAALDPLTATEVMALLVGLSEEQGVTLLVSSHDWQRMRQLSFVELGISVAKSDEAITANLGIVQG